jgi:MFS family permease
VSSRPTLALYIGGFLGPFGGAVLAVLIPELRDAFGATTHEVALAIPAYLVPFASLMLVSGTIGERLGRRRVVRTAYIAYALFSVLSAVAPTLGVFMGARALQGAANAFLTPLVLAGLAEVVPAERLGRTVGTFAAVQTAAIALSPLCGGLLGEIDWRMAFLVPAAIAVVLAFLPPPDSVRGADAQPARLRSAFTRRVGVLSATAFAGYISVTGIGFLVALRAADQFGMSSGERGVLLAAFGLAGMVLGRACGRLVDRFGRIPVAISGTVACAVLVASIEVAGSPGVLAALWFLAGAGSTLVWAGVNTMAVEAVPDNRAGATSVVSAFKFAGNAAAPLVWLPLYAHDLAFLGAGAVSLGATALLALLRLDRVDHDDHDQRHRAEGEPARA